jgi:hypothetical protein
MSLRAAARNEELFRAVNERIEAVSNALATTDPNMDFLCECDQIDCLAKVSATRDEYEAVRAVPTHFIVLPDHVDHTVEHTVVRSNERFAVVEKEGAAARDAADHDPRNANPPD